MGVFALWEQLLGRVCACGKGAWLITICVCVCVLVLHVMYLCVCVYANVQCEETSGPVCKKIGRDISPEEAKKWPEGTMKPS
eukprot:m.61663 g.61663  ORF g.61663 m.61663 type:complete len:82 (-) comp11397_c0_seq3:63-308(-)